MVSIEMRPIENISKSYFIVGQEYIFIEEEETPSLIMRFKEIFLCKDTDCRLFYKKEKCEGIKLTDQFNGQWCGIPEDFKVRCS